MVINLIDFCKKRVNQMNLQIKFVIYILIKSINFKKLINNIEIMLFWELIILIYIIPTLKIDKDNLL